jgi:hypothetical protein
VSTIGTGIASAAIVGFWRAAYVQCGIAPSRDTYGVCPLGLGAVDVYLGILTAAVVVLAVSVISGAFPRLASIAAATLVAGGFLFPYFFAFPDLGVGSWNPGLALGGLLVVGASSGFLETLRYQKSCRLPTGSFNCVTVGGALIAFTGALSYWLPESLSLPTICYGPAGVIGCPLNYPPLLSPAYSLGIIALGIGAASPVLLPRWPEVGLFCSLGAFVTALFAFFIPALPLVAVALGLGAILSLIGVIPRVMRQFEADQAPTKMPPLSARRGSS